MSIFTLIPTCNDPMSQYTVIALSLIMAAGIAAFGLVIWWNLREFGITSDAIRGYDKYISDNTEIITKIQIELAVQESSMNSLKEDIGEIKTDVKTLLTR
jgi:hypothetical protein